MYRCYLYYKSWILFFRMRHESDPCLETKKSPHSIHLQPCKHICYASLALLQTRRKWWFPFIILIDPTVLRWIVFFKREINWNFLLRSLWNELTNIGGKLIEILSFPYVHGFVWNKSYFAEKIDMNKSILLSPVRILNYKYFQ